MASTAVTRAPQKKFQSKHALWVVFGLMSLLVLFTREMTLLDPNSFLRQRYQHVPWLMIFHGVPGAIALVLGAFQFSNRLRSRYLKVHRILGRVYVACALISAPVAVMVAKALPIPYLLPASVFQSFGWISTALIALYCIRTGNVQQHREWMIRSYPFAMVFIVVRAVVMIPPIRAAGIDGLIPTVWATIAAAAFLPSFAIEWKAIMARRRSTAATSIAVAAD